MQSSFNFQNVSQDTLIFGFYFVSDLSVISKLYKKKSEK